MRYAPGDSQADQAKQDGRKREEERKIQETSAWLNT
jgi:hypothetical protein